MIVKGEDQASEPAPRLPKIKEMDAADTPRERAEKLGVGSLSIPDLWAIILRTGIVGRPITQLCRDLMRANDGRLSVLERRTRQELLAIKGLGPLKVTQIQAVMELVRRYNAETPGNQPQIRSSADIAAVMKPRIAHLPHEEVWVMMLSQSHKVLKLFQASKGGWASSLFDIKVIIKEAMLDNATALAMCHNHPSGTLAPSPQDDNITRRLKEACGMLDIQMLDHLIVTGAGYYSYADQGRL